MLNYYNYRLKQIDILLNAFNNDKQFTDEVEELEKEKKEILTHIKEMK